MPENINESIIVDDAVYTTSLTKKYKSRKKYAPKDPTKVYAYIPGVVNEIFVKPGMMVDRGAPLLILEAMKMKNEVFSDYSGKVMNVNVEIGQKLMKKELLIEFEK